jgi:hypothetical protein
MEKNEKLKEILKPLIKKSRKEVLLEEDGIIAKIVSESIRGVIGANTLKENENKQNFVKLEKINELKQKITSEIGDSTNSKMMNFIGEKLGNFNEVDIFSGTKPIPDENQSFELSDKVGVNLSLFGEKKELWKQIHNKLPK